MRLRHITLAACARGLSVAACGGDPTERRPPAG